MGSSAVQVEKAPTVVKTGLKKEEAEELQKKLEAGEDTTSRPTLYVADIICCCSIEGTPCNAR